MPTILVTGAGGFIGRALCAGLSARGHRVVAGLRRLPGPADVPITAAEVRELGDIVARRDWAAVVAGIDIVIHLAQRAHRAPEDRVLDAEPHAAAALACAAAAAGARRFLYLSSIKAMAAETPRGHPLHADDPPRPADRYGRAKLASEAALTTAAAETGIELVIVRPPLVYGPMAGGNFRSLVRLAGSGLPLPFAGIENRRSLLFIDNLVDLLTVAASHPAAAGRVFLAADGDDLSSADLIRLLAAGQDRTARLFAVPEPLFAVLRRLPGIGPAASRLTSSLQVDDQATRALLDWTPPVSAERGLPATARAMARQLGGRTATRPRAFWS